MFSLEGLIECEISSDELERDYLARSSQVKCFLIKFIFKLRVDIILYTLRRDYFLCHDLAMNIVGFYENGTIFSI